MQQTITCILRKKPAFSNLAEEQHLHGDNASVCPRPIVREEVQGWTIAFQLSTPKGVFIETPSLVDGRWLYNELMRPLTGIVFNPAGLPPPS